MGTTDGVMGLPSRHFKKDEMGGAGASVGLGGSDVDEDDDDVVVEGWRISDSSLGGLRP